MIRIPPKGSPDRDRLIEEHKACIESMKGVAGCSILRCATPGDTTEISGGIHEDFQLNRVLLRMRAQPAKGKLVVVCTKIEKEWRIARCSGIRGVPPEFVSDKVYDNEQDPQHDIFPDAARRVPGDRRLPRALPSGLEAPGRQLGRVLGRGPARSFQGSTR